MKSKIPLLLLLLPVLADGQYFQNMYNFDYVIPQYREENFNSGIRTRDNFGGGLPANYYHIGVGVSLNNPGLPAPHNQADRYRFVRTNKSGAMVNNNRGLEFRNTGAGTPFFNSAGNSIAERNNGLGTGGYVGAGVVYDNPITGAALPGGGDALVVSHSMSGTVTGAWRLDFASGYEVAHCIRKSTFMAGTFLVCGYSKQSTGGGTRTDCFVARVDGAGAILWAFTYNFDPTILPFNASCVANQLCEDPVSGHIYVVGYIDDVLFIPNVNALAFALTSGGAVIAATIYDAGPPGGAVTDDRFTSCRFTTDGNIIVGGFTNDSPLGGFTGFKMMITKLAPALGFPLFANTLTANLGSVTMPVPSRCFDILERKNTSSAMEYFLFGPAYTVTGPVQCVYKTDALGTGIEHYLYNSMKFDRYMGIDFADNSFAKPGLALFSSILDSTTGFSQSHLMKTYFDGATCHDYCPFNPPITTLVDYNFPPENLTTTQTYDYVAIKSKNYNYQHKQLCSQAKVTCGSNARQDQELIAGMEKSLNLYPNPVNEQLTVEAFFDKSVVVEVQILNSAGQLIASRMESAWAGKWQLQIPVDQLPAGVYLVMVRDGTTLLKKTFVKN